jgi:hypothetical protein
MGKHLGKHLEKVGKHFPAAEIKNEIKGTINRR